MDTNTAQYLTDRNGAPLSKGATVEDTLYDRSGHVEKIAPFSRKALVNFDPEDGRGSYTQQWIHCQDLIVINPSHTE